MNRDYKFRGKSIESGQWVIGSLVNNLFVKSEYADKPGQSCCYILVPTDDFDDWDSLDQTGGIIEVDPETVGQYTGLKDKNGKEIYEGDIVTHTRFLDPNPIYKDSVVFEEGCFILSPGINILNDYLHRANNVEVIGNLHEHPHLLNPK